MIIVKLMGGLGNQLFAYSLAYSLSRKMNTGLMLDKQIYHTYYSLRICELAELRLTQHKTLMNSSYGTNRVQRKIYNCVHDLKLKYIFRAKHVKEERNFEYQKFELSCKQNYYLTGYWQNYNYFHKYREELVDQLIPRVLSDNVKRLAEKVREEKPIVMHVRRGDYQSYRGGVCLSPQYYLEAIGKIRMVIGQEKKVIIFTDDVKYCKDKFSQLSNIEYFAEIARLKDIEEFYIMSKSSYYVISNSTFSWWAAYLSDYNQGIVIAPIVDQWTREFYPENWIAIDALLEKEVIENAR